MTTQSNNTQEIILYEDLSVKVPQLVDKMKNAVVRARAAADALPEIVDDATKADAFNLLTKVKGAFEQYNGFRMPFTRMLDAITKQFTTTEKDAAQVVLDIQTRLNAFAKKQLEDQRLKEHEEMKKVKEKQDKIDREGKIKLELINRINTFLEVVRKSAGAVVDATTAATLAEDKKRLSVVPKWTQKMETQFFAVPDFINGDEQGAEFLAIAQEVYEQSKKDYETKGVQILADTKSLLEVAINNKEEANRMKESQANEMQRDQAQQIEEVTAKNEADKTFVELDREQINTANVKTAWKIEVKSNAGWLKIIAFAYEHDPKSKTEDFGGKLVKSFRTFAERKVNKDGTRIEHSDVVYVEDVKAKEDKPTED